MRERAHLEPHLVARLRRTGDHERAGADGLDDPRRRMARVFGLAFRRRGRRGRSRLRRGRRTMAETRDDRDRADDHGNCNRISNESHVLALPCDVPMAHPVAAGGHRLATSTRSLQRRSMAAVVYSYWTREDLRWR